MRDGNLRAFIAFELPEKIRAAIADYVQPLRNLPGRVSWVKPENIHLTLKFLGDTPVKRIDGISDALREAVRGVQPMLAKISDSGVFPNERRPRVLWIGIEESTGALQRLAAAIDNRMHDFGFKKEGRGFSPHLTIGRVREGSVDKIIAAMRERPFAAQEVEWNEITLMQSELRPGGSLYTPLCKIKLGNSWRDF
jgi:2'-5' RNA ligase